MKLFRRHGAVRLRLDALERSVLLTMLTDLGVALEPGALDDDDPVRQRLYPAGYRDDEQAEQEFRSLTEASLGEQRLDRVRDCVAQLEGAADGDIVIDAEAGTRWITTLNDLRLALGTRLDITDEEHELVDPDDPLAPQWAAYYWLTGLQDGLVHQLMA